MLNDLIKRLTPTDLLNIEREACRRSLATFIRLAWPVIEPAQPYVHGWHIDAICQHLEAISRGELNRLLINVPPGTMKSLATGVFWPAWEMGPLGRPSTRVLAASHAETLAIRDNLRCRRLIQSEWYQRLWGDTVVLTSDQNEKKKFETTATGFRQAAAFTGMTGARGDRVIIDDPLSVDDAISITKRAGVNTTFDEAVTTRLNNPDKSTIVVIMQRLHDRDVSGHILARHGGYEHLMLPMEFEPERRCSTSIGFTDPRTQADELLFPERFPREVVERDKKALGSYATAGQFQQRPAPREGGLFKPSWFEIVEAAPAKAVRVRAWDLAGTKEKPGSDPDWTVGMRMSRTPDGLFFIEHCEAIRDTPLVVERTIKNTAERDGKGVLIRLPEDPGAGGKAWAAALVRLLVGWAVKLVRPTGSKEARATPVVAQAEAGNIKIVRGPWNERLLEELALFPAGAHDDHIDAMSDAFDQLAGGSRYTLDNV